jgi:IS30 family transposase
LGTFSDRIHPAEPGKCLQMCKEELERYLAEGLSLAQIGERVGRNPSTISYHLKKHGLKPVNQQRHKE